MVVVGQGYVGLALAMKAAQAGHSVVGYELDHERVKHLTAASSHVEDVPDAELGRALASGHYRPTTRIEECREFDVCVIAVPTPLRDGVPDLSHIEDAGAAIAPHVRSGATVVLESTTYPGTTEELLVPILEAGSGLSAGADFHVGYSPERIDPGNREWTLSNTPKVVSGIDADSLVAVQAFYDTFVDETVALGGTKEAELTKLLENTFRHVNIALVNELAMFAHDLGIDVWQAIDAASTKPFGFMRFEPGPGVGGHCLPIDPSYLSWQVRRRLGHHFRFVELANDVNDHMPAYVVRRIMVALNQQSRPVRGARILLLGLSFKRNTADAREAPALRLATQLAELGAEVHAVDPFVADDLGDRFRRVELTVEELTEADIVVVVTDHDEFDYDAVAQHARCVLDTRRRVFGSQVEHL